MTTTVIDSLTLEEQKQVDPQLFTCCPNCRTTFKIPSEKSITRGKWRLFKTMTLYDNDRLRITGQQSRLLYEVARTSDFIRRDALALRICGVRTEDVSNVVAVQVCRLRKVCRDAGIPFPLLIRRDSKLTWIKE